jgi:hypothetical protein
MVAHPKLKRSQKKGYRPSSSDNYPYKKEVQEAKEWLEKILNNNQILNEQDCFRLTQFLLAAQRQLSNNEHERENLRLELEHRENRGFQLGLSTAKISATNRLAIELKEARLLDEDFLKRVKTRIGAK